MQGASHTFSIWPPAKPTTSARPLHAIHFSESVEEKLVDVLSEGNTTHL